MSTNCLEAGPWVHDCTLHSEVENSVSIVAGFCEGRGVAHAWYAWLGLAYWFSGLYSQSTAHCCPPLRLCPRGREPCCCRRCCRLNMSFRRLARGSGHHGCFQFEEPHMDTKGPNPNTGFCTSTSITALTLKGPGLPSDALSVHIAASTTECEGPTQSSADVRYTAVTGLTNSEV